MGLWCRQSMAEHLAREADELFEVTRQGFTYFQERFDYPYPFGAKYDQLFVPDFLAGAMENAACVTFNELYLFRSKVTDAARERRAETVLHELAHMWFGDLVTMRWWDDVWLNESFATYVVDARAGRGDAVPRRVGVVRRRREDVGVPAGPAPHDARHHDRRPRHAVDPAELRRHHVREGRRPS